MTATRPGDGNAGADFRGQKRSNATRALVTDPEAGLCSKSPGTGAGRCFIGHTLMENRNGLIIQTKVTQADGHAERQAALDMIHRRSPGATRRLTPGTDKGCDGGYDCGYDCAEFVKDLRQACVTPHVARKIRYPAIKGRIPRHPGCAVPPKRRRKIEEPFGPVRWRRPWCGASNKRAPGSP